MDRLDVTAFAVCALAISACGGPEEPPRVGLPVVVDSSGVMPVTTDLDYEVELSEARAVLANVVFTIAGEAHSSSVQQASLWQRASDFLVPAAHAHPGHYQAGDVTGELRGRFVVDWLPGGDENLGVATLLVGTYRSANFTFVIAEESDGVSSDDALHGHTAVLRGRATRDGDSVEFAVAIDSPDDRELAGAAFEFEVKETSREELGVRVVTQDPFEGDTLFDGIDFLALDEDGDGELAIDGTAGEGALTNAYNALRRTFQTHDHFDVKPSLPIR